MGFLQTQNAEGGDDVEIQVAVTEGCSTAMQGDLSLSTSGDGLFDLLHMHYPYATGVQPHPAPPRVQSDPGKVRLLNPRRHPHTHTHTPTKACIHIPHTVMHVHTERWMHEHTRAHTHTHPHAHTLTLTHTRNTRTSCGDHIPLVGNEYFVSGVNISRRAIANNLARTDAFLE